METNVTRNLKAFPGRAAERRPSVAMAGGRGISPLRGRRVLTSARAKQCLREGPLGIEPLKFAIEAGAFGHCPDLFGMELVAALGPDRFALLEINCEIAVNRHRLPGGRP